MANTCYNHVTLTGSGKSSSEQDNNLEVFKSYINGTGAVEEDFKKKCLIFWDYYIEDDDVQLFFDTKWSPKIDFVVEFSKTHKLDFIYTYKELGTELFGRAMFIDGVLIEHRLTSSDLQLLQYTDDDTIIFRGDECDTCDENEILNDLLDERILQQRTIKNCIIDKLCDLQTVKSELAGEIEYMLDVYCGDNEVSYIEYERVLEAHEHHAPNGSYHYDFINDDIFLKCIGLSTGETTIEAVLEQYKNYLDVKESRNALEELDFDWDSYCKYCYN